MPAFRLTRALSVRAIACSIALFSSAPAGADGSVSALGMGMGARPGEMGHFDAVVSQYDASGERFRIDGHCQSACTMFLSIHNVCIELDAMLLFHAGNNRSGQVSAASTNHMLATYKPALAKYLTDNHFMDTFEFHTISGNELISRFGYPAC